MSDSQVSESGWFYFGREVLEFIGRVAGVNGVSVTAVRVHLVWRNGNDSVEILCRKKQEMTTLSNNFVAYRFLFESF